MKVQKLSGLLAAVLLTLSVTACTESPVGDETTADSSAATTAADPSVSDTTATEETTAANTQPEAPSIMYSDLNDLEKMVTPFWKMNTMHRESTCMIVREDGAVTAKLAFKPTKILAVESNDFKTVFEEGKDYTWDGTSNTLVWKDGSAIPYFTKNDIEGRREDGTQLRGFDGTSDSWDELGRSRFGNQLYCVSAFLYEKQIAVTYEYEYGTWDGEVTPYQGDKLAKTLAKLEAQEETVIFFYGDSIFTGCDSSSMYNREPNQGSFPQFIKQVLTEKYGGRVKVYNPSVGGKDSAWGMENAQSLICDRAVPDLVFIGFGMNDQGSAQASMQNVQAIIDTCRAQNPDCEFVVVSCMVPNAAAGFLTIQDQLPAVFASIAEKDRQVAFVNMFACHQKLLEQKDFITMSGNNINHPNDWLIRVYTMQMLSAMLEY